LVVHVDQAIGSDDDLAVLGSERNNESHGIKNPDPRAVSKPCCLRKMLRMSFLRNGDIFIVLKSYFDRSGQEDSSSMTLSGIAADDATWATVEAGWWYTLGNRFPKAAYMHMKEAIPLRCEFDAAKGWDDIKVDQLLSDLLIQLSTVDRNSFHQFACTIDMDAYRKLVAEGYKMDDPVTICNDYVARRVMYWFHFVRRGVDLSAAYYFDQGEPFEPAFKSRWETEREIDSLSGDDSVWSHISCVSSADMKTTPGLQ
jgi:hypothetical protein